VNIKPLFFIQFAGQKWMLVDTVNELLVGAN